MFDIQVRQSWCLDALNNKEDFRNIIFVDESTVEMSSSGRLFFHQPGSKKVCRIFVCINRCMHMSGLEFRIGEEQAFAYLMV